jgi:hypothetical protein
MNLINEYFRILTKYLLYFLRMMVESSRKIFLEAGSSRQEFLSSLGIIISSCTIFYNINKIDVKGARK